MSLQKDPERTETKYLHKFAGFTSERVLDADDLRLATIERPFD